MIQVWSLPLKRFRFAIGSFGARCLVLFAAFVMAVIPMATQVPSAKAQTFCRTASTLPTVPDVIDPNHSFVQQIGARLFNITFVPGDPRIAGVLFVCDRAIECPTVDGFYYRPTLSSTNIQSIAGGGACGFSWQVETTDTSPFVIGFKIRFHQGATSRNLGIPAFKTFQLGVLPASLEDGQPHLLSSGQFTITDIQSSDE